MAKKPKRFIKKMWNPIAIYHQPVHGSHAHVNKDTEHEDEKEIKEATEKVHVRQIRHPDHNMNDHIDNSVDGVHEHLTDHYRKSWEKMDHDQKTHLIKYTEESNSLNRALLDAHREGKSTDDNPVNMSDEDKELIKKHGEHGKYDLDDTMYIRHMKAIAKMKQNERVKHIDNAIKNSHQERKHDIYVAHGLKGWHPGIESSKHPEGHVILPSYTSTSLKTATADGFTHPEPHKFPEYDDNLKLRKKGSKKTQTHMLKIRVQPHHHGVYLGDHSEYQHEREFLLPRKTVLKIHKKPTVYHDNDYGAKTKSYVWHADIVHHHGLDDDK